MPLTPKRKKIEKRFGRPLRDLLGERLLDNATQTQVGKELGLDQSTVGYYIKKWNLPYDEKAARRRTRGKWDHLEVCVCVICNHSLCRESRESHHKGRCVMSCLDLEFGDTDRLSQIYPRGGGDRSDLAHHKL